MLISLHSQNFILQNEGVLTNNRRLVTKNMWFNGTDLTKAQRALRNEEVTIVANTLGHIPFMKKRPCRRTSLSASGKN